MLFRNARARNTHVEATLNLSFPAQALVFENDARLKPRELWARVGTCDGAAAAAAAVAAAESASAAPGRGAGRSATAAGCAEARRSCASPSRPTTSCPAREAHALARIGELEAQLADCAARADAALAAAVTERERRETEARSHAPLAPRAPRRSPRPRPRAVRAAASLGALRALVDYELRAFAPRRPDQDHNPLRPRATARRARGPVDDGAGPRLGAPGLRRRGRRRRRRRRARAAAAAAADAAGSRAAGAAARGALADERRVLVAEFRRLKAASDERVAVAKADADEARMGALDEVLKTQDDDRMRALKRKLDAAVRKLEVQLARLDEAAAGDDSPRTSIAGADGTTLL
ncbi:hypothetical protein JL722_4748 [Aureococcus anophagefferens]|nr:hypothetical protein JL722_4748 [Aureococcus anophagefferens]